MFLHKITSNECVSYVPSIIVLRSSWFSECYGLQLETARTPLSSVCTHDALDFCFLIKHMRDPIILADQNHLFCFDRTNAPLFASCRLADYHVKTNLELDKSNQLTQPLHIHVLRELFVFIFSISPEKRTLSSDWTSFCSELKTTLPWSHSGLGLDRQVIEIPQ